MASPNVCPWGQAATPRLCRHQLSRGLLSPGVGGPERLCARLTRGRSGSRSLVEIGGRDGALGLVRDVTRSRSLRGLPAVRRPKVGSSAGPQPLPALQQTVDHSGTRDCKSCTQRQNGGHNLPQRSRMLRDTQSETLQRFAANSSSSNADYLSVVCVFWVLLLCLCCL